MPTYKLIIWAIRPSSFSYVIYKGIQMFIKKLVYYFIVILASPSLIAQPLNWNDSPLNYQNSELNYNNSSLNYQNSPLNYQNSPLNYNSNNGVYDNKGNRLGYETTSPSGVTNIFDNNGNRIGYSPSKNK